MFGVPTIKEIIEDFEYYKNGYNKISGNSVKAINIKERKDKYIADIILSEDLGAVETRYNKCEYPKNLLFGTDKMREIGLKVIKKLGDNLK